MRLRRPGRLPGLALGRTGTAAATAAAPYGGRMVTGRQVRARPAGRLRTRREPAKAARAQAPASRPCPACGRERRHCRPPGPPCHCPGPLCGEDERLRGPGPPIGGGDRWSPATQRRRTAAPACCAAGCGWAIGRGLAEPTRAAAGRRAAALNGDPGCGGWPPAGGGGANWPGASGRGRTAVPAAARICCPGAGYRCAGGGANCGFSRLR
ncbi:hypothetical protein ACU686_21655 [Yinghuangia aomiensis]